MKLSNGDSVTLTLYNNDEVLMGRLVNIDEHSDSMTLTIRDHHCDNSYRIIRYRDVKYITFSKNYQTTHETK